MNNDDGAKIDELKLGMWFAFEVDLLAYYKRYGRQCGFEIMIQRSITKEDGSVKYVTLGCNHGGKPQNMKENAIRPRMTGKTDCKVRINTIKVNGVL